MAWEVVELKLPPEVLPSVSFDARGRVLNAPNITIKDFAANDRIRTGDKREVLDDETLHRGMAQHMPWLMDHFNHSVVRLQYSYGAPRTKITSPLCYMLGVRSRYLYSVRDQEVDMSVLSEAADTALSSLMSQVFETESSLSCSDTPTKTSKTMGDAFNVAHLLSTVDKHGGVEFSDDDDLSGDDFSDTDQATPRSSSTDLKTLQSAAGSQRHESRDVSSADHDELQKIKERCTESLSLPSIEDTIMYDHYAPRGIQRLDVSSIEARLFGDTTDATTQPVACAELDSILLSMLEKGDMMGFSQLISNLRVDRAKLSPQLVYDMLIWKSWMINGQHLCFYGAGSKRQLVRSFTEVALRDGISFTIDAYRLKGATCDGIWYFLKRELLSKKQEKSPSECKKIVLSCVAKLQKPFYLVVLGLDAMVINDALRTLRPLLRISNVYLIGTMDHLRSSLVVPYFDRTLRNYRLVRVATGADYRNELVSLWERMPPRYVLREDNQKSAAEMHAVISALNVNHRQLFSLIAQMQLAECSSGKRFDGIEKYGLLRERRAITICNSESKLDALLTEFITHNLIEQFRGPGGKLYLMIPFPPQELKQFVNL
ncbi:origin recognition complex subunit [Babesia ovis]|uniref:Origin recognition complex subunit 2 n=1 Tax=Babesia ovis TaxID=5869 RepID=A0A9W5T7A6_BABOV|nr:origin recognition complex subunit [Babesia ovis]